MHPEDTKDAWIKIEDVPAFAESAYVLRAGLAKEVYGFGETRMGDLKDSFKLAIKADLLFYPTGKAAGDVIGVRRFKRGVLTFGSHHFWSLFSAPIKTA